MRSSRVHRPLRTISHAFAFPLFLLGLLPLAVEGQVRDPNQPVFFPQDTTATGIVSEIPTGPVSPRSAFLRSLVLPGWGHVTTGSFTRGGFYVAAQSGGLWMLGTALRRRSEAVGFARLERSAVRARLVATGMTDVDSLRVAVEEDPAVRDWEALVEARGQQVEDWVAVSLFALLIGAADAYVAAHLMDYPEPLSLQILPRGFDGGIELALSVPIGGR